MYYGVHHMQYACALYTVFKYVIYSTLYCTSYATHRTSCAIRCAVQYLAHNESYHALMHTSSIHVYKGTVIFQVGNASGIFGLGKYFQDYFIKGIYLYFYQFLPCLGFVSKNLKKAHLREEIFC
jgi:hypothetical protein